MSLAAKLSREFTSKIRKRGYQYFRNGRVKVLFSPANEVDAVVRGSKDYSVRLTLRRMSLDVACTCLYFEEGEECKHIWATILEADQRNLLPDANRRSTLNLVFDYLALEDLQELEEFEDDDSGDESMETTGTQPAAVPDPAWKNQLSLISNTIRENLSSEADQWPAHREIVYLIDPDASRTSGRFTIEIGYRERTMKGKWGKIKSQRIPLSEIPTMRDDADRQILSILSGAKESYGSEPLISLKAGGQGLNLTAAEYVFLLDPWWNPAVEAQAVDRAHRIGQSRRVFAYRLIARDTVEEKVLALQEKKRDLADAIISANSNLMRSITGEDLMLLLS